MAKTRAPQRGSSKGKDAGRRIKKKVSILNTESVDYVDWKDANLLRRFMSDRAKIRARRVTGNDTQQQREVAKAIKNAREMALLPYTNRVTTQRGRRGDREDRGPRGDRGDRGDREDRGPRGDRGDRTDAPPTAGDGEFAAVDAGATTEATTNGAEQ